MKTEFAECHGHMMMDGSDFRTARERHAHAVNEAAVRAGFAALAEAGVTFFRDGGDACGVSSFASRIAAEYGIEYRTPMFAIHKEGRYGGIVGRGFSDTAEFRTRVREARREGCDFIKLMVSGIVTFRAYGDLSCPSLDPEEIRALIGIAHDEGFAIMIHVNGDDAVRACIEAGADSIEHGNFMTAETRALLADSETVWVPTIAAIEAFDGRPGFDPAVTHRTLEELMASVREAASLGACIACGSDSGAVGVPHGPGTLREMELLAAAGAAPKQIQTGNSRIKEIFRKQRRL